MGTIGKRIRAERKALGLTIQELGDKVGLKKSTMAELELGESKSSTKLHKIAAELGVSVSWLETGRGAKHPEAFSVKAEPSQSHDLRQSRPERPEPAMLASSYGWALHGVAAYDPDREKFSPLFEADAAIVCDVYQLLAVNGGTLPGGVKSSELEAIIRRHAQSEGGKDGRNKSQRQTAATKRRAIRE